MNSTANTGKESGDPHGSQPVLSFGGQPGSGSATLIMLHGRGASADGLRDLYRDLSLADTTALVPQAADFSWYPQSFLAPLQHNQPFLDSALHRVNTIINNLIANGIARERIALLGFSQGACLALEYIARNPGRFGAVMGLTGGLIGPPGKERHYPGSLQGTPVFLGTSDPDPHVPLERVLETKAVLEALGASVEFRRYPGMAHSINQEEIEICRQMLGNLERAVRNESFV